jgi:C4-dicarboxylate transporter DctQ subunit
MKTIQTISNVLEKILNVFIVFLILVMTVLMFAQVVGRFALRSGIFWAEELSRFSMITMVYLGAGVACKYREHISVTILDEFLKGTARKIYRIIISAISIAFLLIVARIGFYILPIISQQRSANLQITMNLVYIMVPIGSCIMIFYSILGILELFLTKEKAAR